MIRSVWKMITEYIKGEAAIEQAVRFGNINYKIWKGKN